MGVNVKLVFRRPYKNDTYLRKPRKIFKAYSFGIHRMPMKLAPSVVCMTVKGRNDTMETEGYLLGAKHAA